jgi:hypothetical protein
MCIVVFTSCKSQTLPINTGRARQSLYLMLPSSIPAKSPSHLVPVLACAPHAPNRLRISQPRQGIGLFSPARQLRETGSEYGRYGGT